MSVEAIAVEEAAPQTDHAVTSATPGWTGFR